MTAAGDPSNGVASPDASETPEPRPLAVLDIDGVVADVRHRLHHVERRPRDWGAFFAAADGDEPLAEGKAVAERLARDHELVYLSGRPERLRRITEHWLTRYDFPSGRLLLRPDRDRRPAKVMKVEVLRRLAIEHTVAVVVDDDIAVCTAVRSAGFAVLEADWARDQVSAATLLEVQEKEGRT